MTSTVTCLATASPKQPSSKVWGGFVNESGWSNKGIVFLTGLVNPNYGFGGLDGSIHLAEDCINATTVVPLATIFSILTAVITALFFAVSMLYCISDIESVLSTRTGQVLKRSQNASRSADRGQCTPLRDHSAGHEIESSHNSLHGSDDKCGFPHSHWKRLGCVKDHVVVCQRRSTDILQIRQEDR